VLGLHKHKPAKLWQPPALTTARFWLAWSYGYVPFPGSETRVAEDPGAC